jgi:hypothetical protein
MSTTSSPVPGRPPGRAREALLAYFKDWPRGMTVTSIKQTEWSPERDREDEDDDEREGGASAAKRDRAPNSQEWTPEPAPPGTHGPEGIVEKCFAINDHELMFVDNLDSTAKPRAIKVEWHYMTENQWKARPESKEPGWVMKKVTSQKVIVMRVLV